jgi:hypothetical protein
LKCHLPSLALRVDVVGSYSKLSSESALIDLPVVDESPPRCIISVPDKIAAISDVQSAASDSQLIP